MVIALQREKYLVEASYVDANEPASEHHMKGNEIIHAIHFLQI